MYHIIKTPRPVITMDVFMGIPAGEIFAIGIAKNDVTGLNMTTDGKPLLWIAKKGVAGDWCVYTHYASYDIDFIRTNGDKVFDRNNIDRILKIDDKVWERYRM